MTSIKQALILFAKPPLPGKTKSRLAVDIGNELAAEFSGAMLLDILTQSMLLADVDLFVFHPPGVDPVSFSFYSEMPEAFLEQSGVDLGERMASAFKLFLDDYLYDKVIIIGSDCITHTKDVLSDAFRELDDSKCVIQPADDGGYTLIGFTEARVEPFSGLEWGSNSVFSDTRDILEEHVIDYSEMPVSFDIDLIGDLKKLECHISGTQGFVNTRRVLQKISSY